jgi:hypothetical protein
VIRKELRKYYGPAWREYRLKLILLNGLDDDGSTFCQRCSRRIYGRDIQGAHVTHDPRNNAMVCIWCPACHARNDSPHRLAMMRRSRARRVGQLWLLPESEWACFPAWLIPARVLRDAQGRMF